MRGTKYIGYYREFIDLFDHELASSYPAMSDSFSDIAVPNKKVIIDFILGAGSVDLATSAQATDVYTGEQLPMYDNTRTDGVYTWGEDLAYYVDRYNLMLPDDFVEHIMTTA